MNKDDIPNDYPQKEMWEDTSNILCLGRIMCINRKVFKVLPFVFGRNLPKLSKVFWLMLCCTKNPCPHWWSNGSTHAELCVLKSWKYEHWWFWRKVWLPLCMSGLCRENKVDHGQIHFLFSLHNCMNLPYHLLYTDGLHPHRSKN